MKAKNSDLSVQTLLKNSASTVLLMGLKYEHEVDLKKIIKSLGARILEAKSSKEGLSLLLRNVVSLVIMDVNSSEMDGYEIAKLIRSYDETKDIPLIFLSDPSIDIAYLHLGYAIKGVDFIYSPIDKFVSKSKINVFIELYNHRKALERMLGEFQALSMESRRALEFDEEISGERILIVDDKNENLVALQMILKSINVDMDTALSGQEAIELAEKNDYAVILLDVQMPNMDGFTTAEILRENMKTEATPIIFITAISKEEQYIFEGYEKGAVDYLLKPISPVVIKNKVSVFVKLHMQKSSLKRILGEKTRLISEINIKNTELEHIAHYDVLSDLPNRTQFDVTMKKIISYSIRHKKKFGLFYLDIDTFKMVNDLYGHGVGDKLLKEVGSRLKSVLREEDFIFRLSGDEFAIILQDVKDLNYLALIADKVINCFKDRFVIDKLEIITSLSIGVSCFPDAGSSLEDIVRNADIALRRAKMTGRSKYEFFSKELNDQSRLRMEVSNELNHAIENEELSLNYQPIFSVTTGRVNKLETLLRWNNKKLGKIAPDFFIPIAEDSGVIFEIGEWVIRNTFMKMNELRKSLDDPVQFSINVSPMQIFRKDFVDGLISMAIEYRIDPKDIELEVTESTIMHSDVDCIRGIDKLHAAGFNFAIDDFGTGHSSFSRLASLPISTLKIDKSFILDAVKHDNSAMIVQSIIALANKLNLNVVAEGVETDEQLLFLKSVNCQFGQGYLVSMPLTDEQLDNMIESKEINIKNLNFKHSEN